jgi:hypothetical protein
MVDGVIEATARKQREQWDKTTSKKVSENSVVRKASGDDDALCGLSSGEQTGRFGHVSRAELNEVHRFGLITKLLSSSTMSTTRVTPTMLQRLNEMNLR